MKTFWGKRMKKYILRCILLARFMCQQEQKPRVTWKQGPGMGPKLELLMGNLKCFHRLSEEQEQEYQAELTHISQNKIV